jgi:hypothetical protein
MSSSRTSTTLVIAAVVLTACAAPKPQPPKVNLAGFPPAFRDGYVDGCESAKPRGSKRRDDARFTHDRQYTQGWRDGFDICRKRPGP